MTTGFDKLLYGRTLCVSFDCITGNENEM